MGLVVAQIAGGDGDGPNFPRSCSKHTKGQGDSLLSISETQTLHNKPCHNKIIVFLGRKGVLPQIDKKVRTNCLKSKSQALVKG